MRVVWSYGLVDRPSDRLYVCTILLPEFMDRRSSYTWTKVQTWYLSYVVLPRYWVMANYSCLIPYGKYYLMSQARQRRPFWLIGDLMVCPPFDDWSRIVKWSHVCMYDLISCIIVCLFCNQKYQRPGTRSLKVIGILLGDRLESNHQG